MSDAELIAVGLLLGLLIVAMFGLAYMGDKMYEADEHEDVGGSHG